MSPNTFVFRVDSSLDIGTGHVMRCLTLAGELARQGKECTFVCREHQGHLGDLIKKNGHRLFLLPACIPKKLGAKKGTTDNYALWLGVPWQQDANQTLDIVADLKPDWLVVDHYALDSKWERLLFESARHIMVIDDLADRAHKCSLLLDQNLGRIESDYDGLLNPDCKRLIGPRYALLRPEFESCREGSLRRRESYRLKRILVSLGGIDLNNVTGRLLEALANSALKTDTVLDIIMGSSAPYLDAVRVQASQIRFKASVNVDVNDMAERMYLADVSIGAAGVTSWERCCAGLPAVIMTLAENQAKVANALEESGAAINIGDPENIGTRLPLVLANLSDPGRLKKMSTAAANVTDGKGALDVINSMSLMSR